MNGNKNWFLKVDGFYSDLIHDGLKLLTMNLRPNMVDEFPTTLSCLKDQTWSEGTKLMKLMRSSEVSNLLSVFFFGSNIIGSDLFFPLLLDYIR